MQQDIHVRLCIDAPLLQNVKDNRD